MNIPQPKDELRPQSSYDEQCLRDAGFRWGNKGTHTSKTIMLRELRLLLGSCAPDAGRGEYLSAIREDNCLAKRTVTTRRNSGQRLTELYALDPQVTLFRAMRRCWYADRNGQALLAMLLALARDPLLRVTAPPVLRVQPGEELARQALADAIARTAGNRLNEGTLVSVAQRTASSWTQTGHLEGRVRKVRRRVCPTALTTAYALFVGYLAGARGMSLFNTLWAQVLDAPAEELMHLVMDARRLGFLEMSQSGGVIEVSFSLFLAQEERW